MDAATGAAATARGTGRGRGRPGRTGQHGRCRRSPGPPGSSSPGSWPGPGRRAGRGVLRRHRRVRAGRRAWPSSAPRPGWSTGRPGCAPPAAPSCSAPACGPAWSRWPCWRWCWRSPCGWARPAIARLTAGDSGHVVADHTAGLRVLARLPAAGRADRRAADRDPGLPGDAAHRHARQDPALGAAAARCRCAGVVAMWPAHRRRILVGADTARVRAGVGGAVPAGGACSPGTRCAARTWPAGLGAGPVPGARNGPRCGRDFWRFTGPRALASVAQLALQRVDVLLVAALGGLAAAAVYAVAGRFVVLIQFANQGISQSVQPRLAEALATGDTATAEPALPDRDRLAGPRDLADQPARHHVRRRSTWRCSATATAPARPWCVVLAGAMLVATGCGMVDMVLAMAGRTSWNLVNVLIALAVTIGLDVLLIPRYGALGAAVGLACAVVVNNLLPLTADRPRLRVCTRSAAAPWQRGLLALGCFGVLPAVVSLLFGPARSACCWRCSWPHPPIWPGRGCCATGSPSIPSPGSATNPTRGGHMRTEYTEVFQDTEAVEKYENVTYAPDSYASRINDRQRDYLRKLVQQRFPAAQAGAARLRVRHRPGDPDPARAGPRGARVRHVRGDDGEGVRGRLAGPAGTRSPQDGPVPEPGLGGAAGHRDDVPAAAQRRRDRPGPGAGVRREGAAGRRRGPAGDREPRQRVVAAAPAGTPALGAALVRRAVARRRSARCCDAARLRDRGAARLLHAHPGLVRPPRPAPGRPGRRRRRHQGARHATASRST